ncbi:MAG: hypothetical protein ISR91_06585 [Candidatus Delongbacteria bacterium]|nr:hypothetical protein [bacterium]MBL7033795.1 hypothetical protein [Candidatus Delongbacteria bacterium]
MKRGLLPVMLIALLVFISCEKDKDDSLDVIASEAWEVVLDLGAGAGDWELTLLSDSTITVAGNWEYNIADLSITCPFTNGTATVVDNELTFAASGTASNGFQNSSFELMVSGTAEAGEGNGFYSLSFDNEYWPENVTGIWAGDLVEGGGVTE